MLKRLVILASAAAALASGEQWRAHQASARLNDHNWLRSAPPAEVREAAHESLKLWFSDPHDAFVVLMTVADSSSVPHLRAALAGQPASGDGEECTWSHGRDALAVALSAPSP